MSKDKKYKNRGFTLVEVLICVGIIGIIAAITIPALLSSTSEKALEAQRKALHSRMAQAFGQIKNLKLYEQTTEEVDEETGDPTGNTIDNGSALQFITLGLSNVYKLSNTCDATSVRECSIPNEIYDYWNDTGEGEYKFALTSKIKLGGADGLNEKITEANLNDLNTNYAAFKTVNGESVLLYYNPKCVSKAEADQDNLIRSVCVNMIYDLNGTKAPNAYGEDIGYITVFYPTDPTLVMPILYHNEDGAFAEGTYQTMLATAAAKGLIPPTIEELVSILVNKNLTHITKDLDATKLFWSSSYSTDDTSKAWVAGFSSGVKKQTTAGAGAASHPYFLLKK